MNTYEYRLRQVRFLFRHMFGIRPRLLFRQGAKPRLARVRVTFKRRGSPTKPTLPVTLARTVLTMITSSIASRWSGAIGYCKSNNCGLESVGLTKKRLVGWPKNSEVRILICHWYIIYPYLSCQPQFFPGMTGPTMRGSFSRPWKPSTLLTSTFKPPALRWPGGGQPKVRRNNRAWAA